jgi:hypothetical protein
VIGVITQKDIFDCDNGYKYRSYEVNRNYFSYSSERENEGLLYIPNIDVNIKDSEYMEYIPEKIIKYDLNEFIYDPVDKLTETAIQSQLYNNLLKDLV